MKKLFQVTLLLLLTLPVLITGCKKTELNVNPDPSAVDNSVKAITAYTPCGAAMKVNMYDAHDTIRGAQLGTLTVGNDATKLYLTYALNNGSNYFINGVIYYVGPQSNLPAVPNGVYNWMTLPSTFPQQWYATGEKSNTIAIDLSTLPECFVVVAFARISLSNTTISNDPTLMYISARPDAPIASTGLKNHYGYYLTYCKQSCTLVGKCETAYAFGGDPADCFLTLPGVTSNNWGWTNGPISAGTYNWPIYAGAGQCDVSKGTQVGILNVVYDGSKAKVTYTLNAGNKLTATHLWVGNAILPKKNGVFTTAPGQFPYKHEGLTNVGTDTYTISGLSGNIYVAAHSEVCY